MDLPDLIAVEDLADFADLPSGKATAMITDATAQAVIVAPCLASAALDEVGKAAAKAVLRAAVLRWGEIKSSAKVTHQQTAGVFSQSETYDATATRRGVFWPSEIRALQDICRRGGAYMVDMTGGAGVSHGIACSVVFGASYCDCGADIGLEGP